jgi:hypothetical protein
MPPAEPDLIRSKLDSMKSKPHSMKSKPHSMKSKPDPMKSKARLFYPERKAGQSQSGGSTKRPQAVLPDVLPACFTLKGR